MLKDYADYMVLLECLKRNDLKAFDYLYTNSRNRLYVLAYCIIKDEESAKDLVQEFFIDFWRNRLYENIYDSLKTYLARSVRNRAINYNKKQKTLSRLKTGFSVADDSMTEYKLENTELKGEIDTAILKLPRMAARVFQLHYIEHLTHAQISDKLGISKSTVSGHIDRALKELRTELKKG